MTTFTSVGALRSRPFSRAKGFVGLDARERWLERRMWAAWGLLVLNVLPYAPGLSILHIPSMLGKAITQGALPLSLLLILTVNRKLSFRPNIFMCLMSLLALETVVTALFAPHLIGTGYRTVRFVEFAAVMWLLTPYWGRADMLLIRCHYKTLFVILSMQAVGLVVATGKTLGGRFEGVIWPIASTQVAHYTAIAFGMTVVLWFCKYIKTWKFITLGSVSLVMLILTHTRTALAAALAGILVAGLSLIVAMPRVRKFFTVVTVVGGTAWLTFSTALTSWLARGENAQQLGNLTGRTNFWGPLLAAPRTPFQVIFGVGIGNGLFNGLPIDSNWLSSYNDQGLWGVVICALILIFLYLNSSFAPRGPRRALALFFITYCLVASYTEDGFTSPTTYSLDLMLAASLLVPFGMVRDNSFLNW